MFSNIFFLIIILLLISTSWDGINPEIASVSEAFWIGMFLYGCVLGLLYYQNRTQSKFKNRGLLWFNIEFAIFLIVFFFYLGSQRIFKASFFAPFNQTASALFSLLLYFGAMAVWNQSHHSSKIGNGIRFLLPFVFPFILFIFLDDALMGWLGKAYLDALNPLFMFLMSLIAIIGVLIFLPPIIVSFWKCQRLNNTALTARLQALCEKAHFTHAGFRIWSVMEDALTAAIIGIVGRFRYIMFTQKLLNRISPNSVEAILAHEIGHSYRKHLLIYPLIFFGMIILSSLLSMLFYQGILQYFDLQEIFSQSSFLKSLEPIFLLIPFFLIMAIYFRFVFGYFSRLFERQADLHGYMLDIPPEHMITALDEVAVASGNIHDVPSWHHFSVQERIDFLKDTENNPSLINKHHQKVRRSIAIYLIFLTIITALVTLPLI